MIIDKTTLDSLTAQAKASPRLRMNLDLRNSPADQSQRMLNAIEPGTVLPIHRHRTTSETVVCLRGHFVEYFYDAEGRMTEAIDRHGPGRDAHQHPGGAVAQSGVDGIRHGAAGGQGRTLCAHRAGGCVGEMTVDENG